jgi:DnaD/phage-associated family protein
MAVDRGVFLHYQAGADTPEQEGYLLNTASNRNALERLGAEGAPRPEEDPLLTGAATPDLSEKPNIFALYEENIGMLTPILAEELQEAEESYPWVWVRDAFAVAVTENKRSWRYIAGILRRWAAEGKDHGKPGRHPQKDNRQKYLEDYERRWGSASDERARR